MTYARRAVLATAALTLTLSGCGSITSPAIVSSPYQAGDGTNTDLDGTSVSLDNMLVVSAEANGPGQVVGAVTNSGNSAVTVSLAAAPGKDGTPAQLQITVAPQSQVLIGPKDTPMALSSVPAAPGALLEMTAGVPSGGTKAFTVPVEPPTGYYTGYLLGPSASPSARPSATGSASPSATPSGSATAEASPTLS